MYNDYYYNSKIITLEPLNSYLNIKYNENFNFEDLILDRENMKVGILILNRARDLITYLDKFFTKKYLNNKLEWNIHTASKTKYLSSCVINSIKSNVSINGNLNLASNKKMINMYVTDHGHWNSNDLTKKSYAIIDDAWSFQPQLINFALTRNAGYLFSLPKVIGSNQGGVFLFNKENDLFEFLHVSKKNEYQALSGLVTNLKSINYLNEIRRVNSEIILSKLSEYPISLFFKDPGWDTLRKGALILKIDEKFDEQKFKFIIQELGIRATSFFGNQSIILPNHYLLQPSELEYICNATKFALEKSFIN